MNWFWKLARLIDRLMGGCEHDWRIHDNNSMKRRCLKCKRIEWLFGTPYPAPGEPAYEWKEMR